MGLLKEAAEAFGAEERGIQTILDAESMRVPAGYRGAARVHHGRNPDQRLQARLSGGAAGTVTVDGARTTAVTAF